MAANSKGGGFFKDIAGKVGAGPGAMGTSKAKVSGAPSAKHRGGTTGQQPIGDYEDTTSYTGHPCKQDRKLQP